MHAQFSNPLGNPPSRRDEGPPYLTNLVLILRHFITTRMDSKVGQPFQD